MSGALLQLAAIGTQDLAIRGTQPDVTLWKSTYLKVAQYCTDYEEIEFNGTVGFSQRVTADLTRYADLVTGIYLELVLPSIGAPSTLVDASGNSYPVSGAYWTNAIGFGAIQQATLVIGGAEIDNIYTEQFWFYEEMFQGSGLRMRELIGRFDYSSTIEDSMISFASSKQTLFVPIPFYFSLYRETSLSLPICALDNQQVQVKITFNDLTDLACTVYKTSSSSSTYHLSTLTPYNNTNSATLASSDLSGRLFVSYVYLNDDERLKFKANQLDYIILQNQRATDTISNANQTSASLKVYFNHPSTFIAMRIRPTAWNTSGGRRRYSIGFKDRFDYSGYVTNSAYTYGDVTDPILTMDLQLNGHSRWPSTISTKFQRLLMPMISARSLFTGYEYLFAFANKIFESTTTSTLNFSKIDNITINLTFMTSLPASDVFMNVANFNVYTVKDAGSGLKYAA
jgi:hypothetical protein